MIQLVREWPPGYGGVERVAHNLGEAQGGIIFALRGPEEGRDSLLVTYQRVLIPSVSLGPLLIPRPCYSIFRVLFSSTSLIGHLPCPTVLLLILFARILRPTRRVSVYWHAFLDPRPGLRGWMERFYLFVALRTLQTVPTVTTSPPLKKALAKAGIPKSNIHVLPCSLPPTSEHALMRLRSKRHITPSGRILFIGRLDSYKRLDWLIEAFYSTPSAKVLDIAGDGPDRIKLETQAADTAQPEKEVRFHGRVSETFKAALLLEADLLVLPANRCNEAFGIVQLEAMASGMPALAFDLPRSGMHWVSQLDALPWSGKPDALPTALESVLGEPERYKRLCLQARQRYDGLFANAIWREQLLVLRDDDTTNRNPDLTSSPL